MKKYITIMLLLGAFSQGACLESIIKGVDNLSLSSKYKKIAYYAYLLKMKREYIAKAYLLLADIRNEESKNFLAFASSTYGASSIPLIQAGTLESDIIGVANKYNLAYLNMLLYKQTKKEIKDIK